MVERAAEVCFCVCGFVMCFDTPGIALVEREYFLSFLLFF